MPTFFLPIRYTSTFDMLLTKDKSVSFHHRNIHALAIEMYKVKNGLAPSFFCDLFTYVGRGDRFAIPNVRTVKKGKHSIRYFGPLIWNTMLPSSIKSSDSLEAFKSSIRGWVPKCK